MRPVSAKLFHADGKTRRSLDVLLTEYLSITLQMSQINAQNSCFIITLLYASTMGWACGMHV